MEETDIEVLEPQDNWKKEIPVTAEVRTIQVPVQQIIVNNEVKQILGESVVLICPKCKTIIQQFQPGIPEVEVVKALNTDKEQVLNATMYCKGCGQKLRLMRPMPVEGTYDIQESAE